MASIPRPDRRRLAPDLDLSRIVTGLWQVADMERDGPAARPRGRLARRWARTCRRASPASTWRTTTARRRRSPGGSSPAAARPSSSPSGSRSPGPVSRETVRAAVTRALRRLRRERIDLLQFHAWRFSDPAWLDALFFLEELRAEGLVGHLGAVNFDTAHLRVAVASGIRLVSNQVAFSLLDRRAAGRMSAFCRDHGVQLLAYGALAGGFLTERWLDRPAPTEAERATWSQMKYHRFIEAAGRLGADSRRSPGRSPRWRRSTTSRWPTWPAGRSSTSPRWRRSSSARASGSGRTSRTTHGSSRSCSTTRTAGRSPRRQRG